MDNKPLPNPCPQQTLNKMKTKGYKIIFKTELSEEECASLISETLNELSVSGVFNYLIEMTDKEIQQDVEDYFVEE